MTIYIAEKLTELLSDYINRYNILSCRCVIITGQGKEDFISTGMITQGIPFSPGLPDLLNERDLLQSNRDFIITSDAVSSNNAIISILIKNDTGIIGACSINVPYNTLQDSTKISSALSNDIANLCPTISSQFFSLFRYPDLFDFLSKSPLSTIIINNAGNIKWANKSAKQVFPTLQSTIATRNITDIIPNSEQHLTVTLNGSAINYLINSVTLFQHRNEPLTIITFHSQPGGGEITDKMLENAELSGIMRTVTAINHEINSPLFGMIMTLDMLKEELKQIDSSIDILTKVEQISYCASKIREITDKLSQVSRPVSCEYTEEDSMLDIQNSILSEDNTSEI
jgi:hypothetical protein